MISASFAFVRFVISRPSVVFGIVGSMSDHGSAFMVTFGQSDKRDVESLVYICAEIDPARDGHN